MKTISYDILGRLENSVYDIQDVDSAPLFLEIIDVSKDGDKRELMESGEKMIIKGPVFECVKNSGSRLEMEVYFWDYHDGNNPELKSIGTMVMELSTPK